MAQGKGFPTQAAGPADLIGYSFPAGRIPLPQTTLHPTVSYDPHPIRWIEVELPHPEDPDRMLTLKADGPYALRSWYFAPGTRTEIKLHLDQRTQKGGLNGCLHCGSEDLYVRRTFFWPLAATGALLGILLWFLMPVLAFVALGLGLLGAWLMGASEITCYRCTTKHRGFDSVPNHGRFDSAKAV